MCRRWKILYESCVSTLRHEVHLNSQTTHPASTWKSVWKFTGNHDGCWPSPSAQRSSVRLRLFGRSVVCQGAASCSRSRRRTTRERRRRRQTSWRDGKQRVEKQNMWEIKMTPPHSDDLVVSFLSVWLSNLYMYASVANKQYSPDHSIIQITHYVVLLRGPVTESLTQVTWVFRKWRYSFRKWEPDIQKI